jgi:Nucleotidyl transferase AbiEii toxin, Type IV TA system
LRILARDFPDDFIFKGGTSLSKGYHLIRRFSEDIDILIIPGATATATHALMRRMASAVEAVLGGQTEVVSSGTGVHRSTRIQYPAAHMGSGIRPDVLLEPGIRGGLEFSDRLPVGCLLGEALQAGGVDIDDYGDLQPFDVQVLQLGRTLMEKLGLVHSNLGADPSDQQASRHVRHYYDIYVLLGDERALAVLRDRAEFSQILASMREVNDRWLGGAELRPEAGWASSPAFDTARPSYQRLVKAYDSVMADL